MVRMPKNHLAGQSWGVCVGSGATGAHRGKNSRSTETLGSGLTISWIGESWMGETASPPNPLSIFPDDQSVRVSALAGSE